MSVLITIIARIIANQPLRAKEASPFVSQKYPVIVSCNHSRRRTTSRLIEVRTMNMMRWLLVLEVLGYELPLDWPRQASTPPAYPSYSLPEVIQ
jgi:hypothetical protein